MLVFARLSLVPPAWRSANALPAGRCALLLEGDWPQDATSDTDRRFALDTEIDAAQFAHLDDAALQLTTEISQAADPIGGSDRGPSPNFAELNALRLRYETLRWLRIIAFRRARGERATDEVELYLSPGRDNEYATLWQAMARAFGFTLRLHFVLRDGAAAKPFMLPHNAWWRRLLARWCANRATRPDSDAPPTSAHRPRLLFVGNPRILDPVCDAVLDRGANVAWLYDRFAVGVWWSRRASGIEWLTCDGSTRERDSFPTKLLNRRVEYDRVDLSETVEAWFHRWHRRLAAAQSRQWRSVGEHLESLRPTGIVLDEDATPLARITIAHAARLGIPTTVVQHGVCCVRFGFTPLAADRFCAWDEGTRRQLAAWNVPADRVVVTGPPRERMIVSDERKTGPKRIVLLATLPPRDDRPDAVEFHLTTRTYAAMLHAACAAVDELNVERSNEASSGAELIVKLHPRASHDPLLIETLSRFPRLRHRLVIGGALASVLSNADAVLSCVSSSGIEAAAAGLPVVQLLPQGSGNVLPAAWYGLLGSARILEELRPLLRRALETARESTTASGDEPVLARGAERIADLVLGDTALSREASETGIVAPHFVANRRRSQIEEVSHG